MNFETVNANNGNLVDMFGTFMEIGGVHYTQNQKAKAVCKIADDNGVSHKVHLHQGNGQLPTPANLQQRHAFSISTFQGTYQGNPYIGYSGFWNSKTKVNQTTQTDPPQPSQAPQQPRQDTKAPRNGRDISIERQAAFKAACEYAGRSGLKAEQLIKVARAGHYFIETGNSVYDIPEPDESITEPPEHRGTSTATGAAEDDIPF